MGIGSTTSILNFGLKIKETFKFFVRKGRHFSGGDFLSEGLGTLPKISNVPFQELMKAILQSYLNYISSAVNEILLDKQTYCYFLIKKI